MSYTAAMLAWAVYEYKDAFVKSGQLEHILNQIEWVNDYFVKCHPSKYVYYYQVGDGGTDHAWWGPAEVSADGKTILQSYTNKSRFCGSC